MNSNWLRDIELMIALVRQRTGHAPDVIWLSAKAWSLLPEQVRARGMLQVNGIPVKVHTVMS